MYKLVAIDMDGTLLKEDKTVSEHTKEVLEKAKQKGVKIVVATGRPIEGIREYLKELNLQNEGDVVVCYNGALVQDTYTKEAISKIPLKGSDLLDLYKIAKDLNVNIHAFSKLGCITPKMSKYSEVEGSLNNIDVLEIDFNTIESDEDITKIMIVDEEEILQPAIDKMPKWIYDKYTVVRSAPFFLEFLDKRVHKGAGVKALAEKLGIKREEIICIGDAGNDEQMIKYAGLGVAMGNAFDEIKKIADFVTKTNEEDGVAYVIEKFILDVPRGTL